MKKNNSLWKWIILGLLIGIIIDICNIKITLTQYFIVLFIVLGYSIIKNLIMYNTINKYYKNKDLDLKDLEEYINKKKSNLKQYYLLNLSSVYSNRNKDNKKALEILEKIDITVLNTKFKALYYNNLAYTLLKNDRVKEAKEVLDNNIQLLNKYLNNKQLGTAFLDTIEEVKKAKIKKDK